ncbi:Rha family transcriptional regulator [Loktanella sp. SALINAS62]|uniref:Rha family transcriptional regulator n=1 Tax=Loktanella sp. SALINAS62 TaxID=2706124 RepID=UPI001B8B5817|nr:Rha family transcriptional regulator [Loktanella sp. SALINAS62]
MIRKGDTFITTSRDVADYFGKQHKDVLEAIRTVAAQLTAEKSAICFQLSNFDQKTGFGTRPMPLYEMTRDGFTLLVMGFTAPNFRAIEIETTVGYGTRPHPLNPIMDAMRSRPQSATEPSSTAPTK